MMGEVQADTGNDLSEWLSTYGLITAERILERYSIRLQRQDLISAIKSPNTFYHRLIRVPLRNVLNGIILQQAHDYQVYAQKLFIDYLMSGETAKGEDSPGALTREDLEKDRQTLIKVSEEFHETELAHNLLIAESQKSLITLAREWQVLLLQVAKKIKQSLHSAKIAEDRIVEAINILLITQDSTRKEEAFIQEDSWPRIERVIGQSLSAEQRQEILAQLFKLKEFMAEAEHSLNAFMERIQEMTTGLRNFRSQFYQLILSTNELIKLLPEYHPDNVQVQENRESLYFDKAIGEQS
jgi:hypothetical protein